MLYSAVVLLAALAGHAAAGILERAPTCKADNCARAVTGTAANLKVPLTSRQADCSSYLATTVMPGFIESTTITATSVPTYASACGDFEEGRYSSACVCGGTKPSTVIQPAFGCPTDPNINDSCGCGYDINCYTTISGTTVLDFDIGVDVSTCLNRCSSSTECFALVFEPFPGFCTYYGSDYVLHPRSEDPAQNINFFSYVKKSQACTCDISD